MIECCVVFDLEATCWERGGSPRRMETIEFGAVKLRPGSWQVSDEFASFVKPIAEPVLSDFCRQLTSIRQEDVEAAPPFPEVLAAFVQWIGLGNSVVCSWGAYDLRQLRVDCDRHRIQLPTQLENHINLKLEFAANKSIQPCGMQKALRILGLELTGTHHRGIDDARNIARIAQVILPGLLESKLHAQGSRNEREEDPGRNHRVE